VLSDGYCGFWISNPQNTASLWRSGLLPIINQTHTKAGLILHEIFLCDFALMQLENLHHISNLCDNFRFNTIWHMRSVVTLITCRRLAESEISVMPSNTCMDWLCWWYNYMAHLFFFWTALPFLTNISEKHKSASPIANQVKNQQKTIGSDEVLWHIANIYKTF